jgi:hypothetical protein
MNAEREAVNLSIKIRVQFDFLGSLVISDLLTAPEIPEDPFPWLFRFCRGRG